MEELKLRISRISEGNREWRGAKSNGDASEGRCETNLMQDEGIKVTLRGPKLPLVTKPPPAKTNNSEA